MNLKIREMSATLKKYIDSVDLPFEVKRMVLKEIYDDSAEKADEAVREEISERDAAEQEENQNEQGV